MPLIARTTTAEREHQHRPQRRALLGPRLEIHAGHCRQEPWDALSTAVLADRQSRPARHGGRAVAVACHREVQAPGLVLGIVSVEAPPEQQRHHRLALTQRPHHAQPRSVRRPRQALVVRHPARVLKHGHDPRLLRPRLCVSEVQVRTIAGRTAKGVRAMAHDHSMHRTLCTTAPSTHLRSTQSRPARCRPPRPAWRGTSPPGRTRVRARALSAPSASQQRRRPPEPPARGSVTPA